MAVVFVLVPLLLTAKDRTERKALLWDGVFRCGGSSPREKILGHLSGFVRDGTGGVLRRSVCRALWICLWEKLRSIGSLQ